jgi:hypothetical protein
MPSLPSTTKRELMEKFGRGSRDTGSPEVQVALLTARINQLAPHFEHDFFEEGLYLLDEKPIPLRQLGGSRG